MKVRICVLLSQNFPQIGHPHPALKGEGGVG
jgi:hypothetical protein